MADDIKGQAGGVLTPVARVLSTTGQYHTGSYCGEFESATLLPNGTKLFTRPTPAAAAGVPTEANDCRIELVTTIHGLVSQIENTLYAFGKDMEARRQAEGAMRHARNVADRWNWNGAWSSPVAPAGAPTLSDEREALRELVEADKAHNIAQGTDDGAVRYAAIKRLSAAHARARALLSAGSQDKPKP